MSHKRKGQLADSNEWRKHLRPLFRRFYWKRERLAEKYEINHQLRDSVLRPNEQDGFDIGVLDVT